MYHFLVLAEPLVVKQPCVIRVDAITMPWLLLVEDPFASTLRWQVDIWRSPESRSTTAHLVGVAG
jgi:hypothetical protein